MQLAGIEFIREFGMQVFYRNHQIGAKKVDFFVEEKVSVELKALIHTEPVHLAQAINNLEAYNPEIGLLINFGNVKLEFHRLENKKYKAER